MGSILRTIGNVWRVAKAVKAVAEAAEAMGANAGTAAGRTAPNAFRHPGNLPGMNRRNNIQPPPSGSRPRQTPAADLFGKMAAAKHGPAAAATGDPMPTALERTRTPYAISSFDRAKFELRSTKADAAPASSTAAGDDASVPLQRERRPYAFRPSTPTSSVPPSSANDAADTSVPLRREPRPYHASRPSTPSSSATGTPGPSPQAAQPPALPAWHSTLKITAKYGVAELRTQADQASSKSQMLEILVRLATLRREVALNAGAQLRKSADDPVATAGVREARTSAFAETDAAVAEIKKSMTEKLGDLQKITVTDEQAYESLGVSSRQLDGLSEADRAMRLLGQPTRGRDILRMSPEDLQLLLKDVSKLHKTEAIMLHPDRNKNPVDNAALTLISGAVASFKDVADALPKAYAKLGLPPNYMLQRPNLQTDLAVLGYRGPLPNGPQELSQLLPQIYATYKMAGVEMVTNNPNPTGRMCVRLMDECYKRLDEDARQVARHYE